MLGCVKNLSKVSEMNEYEKYGSVGGERDMFQILGIGVHIVYMSLTEVKDSWWKCNRV